MKAFFQKGQESAPFELLVAVTLMIFVIAAGLNAMSVLGRQQCIGQIDKKLEEMKTAIELVASGKGASNVDFTIPKCFKGSKTEIRYEQKQAICSRVCGGVRRECILLRFESAEESMAKCLNVSLNTTFIDQPSGSSCTDREPGERLELVDLKNPAGGEGIPLGYYSLVEVQNPSITLPMICAYRRKG